MVTIIAIWSVFSTLLWFWASDRAAKAEVEKWIALGEAGGHYSDAILWFYRTRIAHARRKRLQRLVDKLFERLDFANGVVAASEARVAIVENQVATVEVERALLRGEVDSLRQDVDRYENLCGLALNQRDAAEDQRDSAVARAAELGRETTLLLEERRKPARRKTPKKGRK